jgi:hypothetical protein
VRSRRPRHDRGHDPRPAAPDLPWETPEAVADAELGARLERALREGPGSGHVDVAQLLRGTRQATTKRARVRRTAMIAAAAVAVGAVPVGLQTARWMSPEPVVPATGLTNGPDPTPSPTATPSAPPTPTAAPPQALPTSPFGRLLRNDPKAFAYPIPDSVAFDQADLPVPMEQILDLGDYRWIPTVQGQECNEMLLQKLEQPIAGRSWTWLSDPAAGRKEQLEVQLSVTGWASERSAELQLGLVRRDAGACRFAERVSTKAATVGTWLAVGARSDGVPRAYAAAVLPGGLVVAVTVTGTLGADDGLKTVDELLRVATRNVERSGLPKELIQLMQASGRQLGGPATSEANSRPGAVSPDPAATQADKPGTDATP